MNSTQSTSNPLQGSLTNKPERFSEDAWNLLLASEVAAKRWRHIDLDVEHLLQVLFGERAYRRFVEGLTLNNAELLDRLEGFLADQPISTNGDLFVGDDLEDLLETADHFRSKW